MKDKTETLHVPQEFQEKCDAIAELMADGVVREAKKDYAIGRLVVELMADEDRYGKGSVKRVAKEVDCKPALLYAHATVARMWDENQFDTLLERMNGRGMPLSFSHFVEVAKVENEEARAALVEDALSKSWSVRDLKDALSSARKARNPSLVSTQFLKKCATTSKAAIERIQEEIASLKRLKKKGAIDRAQMVEQLKVVVENCRQASDLYAELEVSLTELLVDDSDQKAAE